MIKQQEKRDELEVKLIIPSTMNALDGNYYTVDVKCYIVHKFALQTSSCKPLSEGSIEVFYNFNHFQIECVTDHGEGTKAKAIINAPASRRLHD